MKIDLPCSNRHHPNTWGVVKAEIVDIAPHITVATFAVHRGAFGDYGWTVSNIETGAQITCFHSTKEIATRAAKLLLSEKHNEAVLLAFEYLPKWCRK